ncbi:hypothetical protein B7494_g2054 [Chlorociboria aeruginascens]|nr:hypothetical protein B7494_g2054 [Chlorociboria aeruginascens]
MTTRKHAAGVVSDLRAPVQSANDGRGGTFTTYSACTVAAPPSTVFNAVVDTSTWSQWNTGFIPYVTLDYSETANPADHDGSSTLVVGVKATFHALMKGEGTQAVTDSVERITEGYKISWRAHGWSDWVLRTERTIELIETEDGITEYVSNGTFGGPLATVIKLAIMHLHPRICHPLPPPPTLIITIIFFLLFLPTTPSLPLPLLYPLFPTPQPRSNANASCVLADSRAPIPTPAYGTSGLFSVYTQAFIAAPAAEILYLTLHTKTWALSVQDRRLGGPRLNAATPRNPLERIDRLGTGQEGPDRLGGCLVCPFLAATQFFASRRPREVEGQSDSSHRRTWWTRDSKLAMAWDHLAINRPHLVYIILGGFTSLFMLCSSFIKERLYIGEATVATICGVIFGPHAANLINPLTWGNTDQITLEFSRIVLVVQCFAVGVELPKYYMEKHWRSVVFLLIPVMTFGWLITSLFVWWMIPNLNWLSSLCVAACVTATDPVLASSVVGKGKFAKRVPKHLRDVLSAESGCNDGMAFPFIYLALYLIEYSLAAGQTTFHWIVITILYECVFGAIYGFCIGYIGRHGIKWAEKHDLVDRESFLVFYFVLALFCAGSGSIIGVDDLLVGFSAGVGFSNDGWFTQKTEESHVSNVIDLLLNLAYFVYLGTVIPWEQYNNAAIYLTPWRLVVLAIFVILFRRIPIMLALKPLIPDIKTWREALFAGHFGPIGVGAIFVAILARAALETGGATPLATIPEGESFDGNALLIAVIWPITTFLVISSILVHGSSIAVFTLGKHINTLTLTMSYTTAHEDGPGWINRLPRITSVSRSQAKTIGSETDAEDVKLEDLPPGTLPPIGLPGHFLRRQREEDNPSRQGSRASSLIPRRRKKRWDDGLGPGGPISESAIFPQRRSQSAHLSEQTSETLTTGDSPKMEHTGKDDDEEKHEGELGEVQHDPEMEEIMHRDDDRGDQHKSDAERHPYEREIYVEGDDVIMENEDGDVTNIQEIHPKEHRTRNPEDDSYEEVEKEKLGYKNLRKKLGVWRHKDEDPHGGELRPSGKQTHKTHGPALAYQYGNTIIVEDEDGEVVKTYQLPPNQNVVRPPKETGEEGPVRQGISRVGTWTGLGGKKPDASSAESKFSPPNEQPINSNVRQGIRMGNWGFSGKNDAGEGTSKRPAAEDSDSEDDRRIRFTIGGAGRRLTKEDFLREIQSLDPKARSEIVEQSDAPPSMKAIAKRDADKNSPGSNRLFSKDIQAASGAAIAKTIGAEMAKKKGVDVDSTASPAPAKPKPAYVKSSRESESSSSSSISPAKKASNSEMTETAAERRRREQALKGVEDVTPAQRGDPTSRTRDRNPSRIDPQMETSSRGRSPPKPSKVTGEEESETAAERKRREAALGVRLEEEDSDDDDTPRVPPPVKSRGIRFATSPVRGRH